LVFIFPEAEDDYVPITPRGYDNLPEEAKGEIRYLEYSDNRKPPSFHYIDTEGISKVRVICPELDRPPQHDTAPQLPQ
jgi:hypothetical protein